jgi:hypothetical protein
MKKTMLVLVAIMLGLLSGCSAHFTKLPRPEEFIKSIGELRQEYPDLVKFEHPSVSIFGMAPAEELTKEWGQPDFSNLNFPEEWKGRGLYIPIMWAFHPSTYWFWEFDGKCIAVLIDRPMGHLYKPYVWALAVIDNPCSSRKDLDHETKDSDMQPGP